MQIKAVIRQRSTDWVLQFINIVFLMLLYFLVNGTVAQTPQSNIHLPLAAQSNAGLPPHNALYVDLTGKLFFQGQRVSASALPQRLPVADANPVIIVAADKRLPAAQLLKLLAELRGWGFSRLSVLAVKSGQS